MLRAAVAILLASPVWPQQLELRGRIEPAPEQASVSIHGANAPFTAQTMSDDQGRFRFRALLPGAYTIAVFVPGRGEVRRTVAVSPSLADREGRVSATIDFTPATGTAGRESLVSARELAIPDRARREYAQAEKKLGARDVAGAIRHLELAVKLAPRFVAAWNYLGTIAYQSRDFRQAEKHFREALSHQPGAFEPVVNLGGVLINLANLDEALKYNQYAVLARPDDVLANSQLGITCFLLGDDERALRHLQIARKLDPAHFSHPQLVLAQIYLRRSDRTAALRELDDFLARHPDAPEAAKARDDVRRLRQP